MEKVEDGRKMKERKFYEYGKENDIEGAMKAIEEGIDIHSTNKRKQTALHLSLYHKHFQFAYFLINNTNIDIEATDIHGNSPLISSVIFLNCKKEVMKNTQTKKEIFEFVIYLIETKKVSYELENNRKRRIYEMSIRNHQYEVAKYLVEKEYFPITRIFRREYRNQWNSLHHAFKKRADEDFMIYLEEKGGNH